MSNYFEEIENEFSRIRGKYTRVSPLDWALMETWEKKDIPLSIVLRAMSETWRKHASQKKAGTINTLRYFEPEIEKQFADYCAITVGKSDSTAPDGEAAIADDDVLICQNCIHYHIEKGEDNFYGGWCEAEGVWMIEDGERYPDILKSRLRCNPESDDELPENYQFFEPETFTAENDKNFQE